MIETVAPTSRQEWLGLRGQTVGASEAAALFGVHPWMSAFELYHSKSGMIPSDQEETPPMRRGRHLEQVAVNFLREERPDWTVIANPMPGGQFFRDLDAGMSCTPDAFIFDPARPGQKGICQIKSVEPSVYRKKWKTDDGTVEPPLYVAIQALQEAHLVGAQFAVVCPLVISFGIEMPVLDVPIHHGVLDRLQSLTAEFWNFVRTNTPPPPDFAKDGELLAELHAGGNGEVVDLSGSNRLPLILDEDERLKDEIKLAKDRRDEIKAEVVHALGRATFGTLPGWSISLKSQTRRAHTVKESTFSVLRMARA